MKFLESFNGWKIYSTKRGYCAHKGNKWMNSPSYKTLREAIARLQLEKEV